MKKKLVVIIPDRLSVLVNKGEVVPRYYNPGDVFDEVHIMMTNDDKPDIESLQVLVGSAKVYVHNILQPDNFFKMTLGFQPVLMRNWAKSWVQVIKNINPDLIRCQGIHVNAFVAVTAKEELQVPVVISLHGNPDVDYLRGRLAFTLKEKIIGRCQAQLEKYCLQRADHIVAVYSPIVPYLVKNKIKSFSVIYNVVGINAKNKVNYDIKGSKFNLICIGRQTKLQKDPSNIVHAVAKLDNVHLTLVGDGDLNEHLKGLARSLNCANRIDFISAMDNKILLDKMCEMDGYIYHSINYEISKSCIEAALIGLPVILNNRTPAPANEILEAGFCLVEDNPDAYASAISKIISDKQYRIKLARNSNIFARKHWDPQITESKLTSLYKELLQL